ncbi:MAG: DUF559 domain-containing protein [FCB group bacterium]|nr:DUF559 domain-containing protein [FCB group bacterium]
MTNTTKQGDEREREFLAMVSLSQKGDNLATVRDPDRHLDSEGGQLKVYGKKFDFAWEPEDVLVELDGGQWVKGGGRHNSDADRWKTLDAQAAGWTVLHISYTMFSRDPIRVLARLYEVLWMAVQR